MITISTSLFLFTTRDHAHKEEKLLHFKSDFFFVEKTYLVIKSVVIGVHRGLREM